MLSRSEILKTDDLPRREIQVPEWGGSVTVRGLTGKERDEFEQSLFSIHGQSANLTLSNARARLVVLGCVDEEGNKVFSQADVSALGSKNAMVLDRLADAIRELSGMNTDDIQQAANFFTLTRNNDSTSG